MFNFYKSTYNPVGLSGTVGGAISSVPLSGYLNELFAHVDAPPSGIEPVYQYRKIHIVNEFVTTSTYTKVWLDEVDHTDQLSIALEPSGSSQSSSPTTAPSGISTWYSPSNYVEGISIGTLVSSAHTGLWIRQTLTGIVEEDPFATCRICVGGIIA